MIKRIQHLLPLHAKLTLNNSHCLTMETQCGVTKIKTRLWVLQNKAAKVLLNLPPRSSSTKALDRLHLKTLSKRIHFYCCVMMQKYLSREIDYKFDIRRDSFHFYQAMIYTFLVYAPTGASKLSFFKPLRTGTT